MDRNEITPFRISKRFEEHVPELLEELTEHPEGMYQVTYRVGPVVVSAHVWIDEPSKCAERNEMTQFDRDFLKELHISADENSAAV
jgi:hypothetical protein